MEERLIQLFRQIVSEQTGLNIRDQDRDRFGNAISSRTKSLRLSSAEGYYDFLKSGKGRAEWQEIVKGLTTGETYFFRDKGQFSLLRLAILPELIERNKAKKSLRIWSAGCSTGEEAYSLAILIEELVKNPPIPPLSKGGDGGLEGWSIVILGTDINEGAIEKAKTGHYGEWSFRQVGDEIRKQYFQKMKKEWLIDERIQGMVRFEVMNLIRDDCPNYGSELHDMDLILCRNVFIYFKPEVVSKVVEKMTDTLRDGGYLMTGHAELRVQEFPFFKTKVFPESVVYQKSAEFGVRNAELKPIPSPTLYPSGHKPLKGRGVETQNFASLPEGQGLEEVLAPGGCEGGVHSAFEKAQEYADKGDYKKAEESCKKALEAEPYSARCYYLLSQVSEAQGKGDEAAGLLKKAIYLDSSFVAAYLELGYSYDRQGDAARAKKMRETAVGLLEKLPKDALVAPYKDVTAGELLEYVRKMIEVTSNGVFNV